MDTVGRGVIAGFIAMLILSALIDPMTAVARIADLVPRTFAWILHLFVGSFIWGAGFALLHPLLRGPSWLRGLLFGALAWLLVMVVVMPLARTGLFGLKLGLAAPAVMLAVHLAYGIMVGVFFAILDQREGNGPARDSEADDNRLHPLPR
jgi:peptidoglycan/LPS O-acetylase OafA/YrhL